LGKRPLIIPTIAQCNPLSNKFIFISKPLLALALFATLTNKSFVDFAFLRQLHISPFSHTIPSNPAFGSGLFTQEYFLKKPGFVV
jgi:hypothetical protein